MLPIIYGLLAALSWGSGDFTGGMAARKIGAYLSVFYGEVIGMIILCFILFFNHEAFPDPHTILFASIAGAFGTLGLMMLYHAMSIGLMSIAAPVSALLAAMIPVIVGISIEGTPGFLTLFGFVFALFAVWMISQHGGRVSDIFSHLTDLKLPLLAGIGFGLYFVFMHEATKSGANLWPTFFSRASGTLVVASYIFYKRMSLKIDRSVWPAVTLNGALDLSGNFFFILSAQTGRLDVASVLSAAIFPGVTVMLAWIILHERLNRSQWIGVAAAITAIALITL